MVKYYEDLAMVQLSSVEPTIYLSLDLLLPRNKNKYGFLEVAKSSITGLGAVKKDSELSEEEKSALVVEIAFLHELGHIFSILKHTNKNYFLQTANQPILESLKRNYEESFAEAFCIYMLKEKYPHENFLKWLKGQRQQNAAHTKGNEIIYEYDIAGIYDLVKEKFKPDSTIKTILKDIESIVYKNLLHIVQLRINTIKTTEKDKRKDEKQKKEAEITFLSLLNKELGSGHNLQSAQEVIDKIKADFAVYTAPQTPTAISHKIFKLRESQNPDFVKNIKKLG